MLLSKVYACIARIGVDDCYACCTIADINIDDTRQNWPYHSKTYSFRTKNSTISTCTFPEHFFFSVCADHTIISAHPQNGKRHARQLMLTGGNWHSAPHATHQIDSSIQSRGLRHTKAMCCFIDGIEKEFSFLLHRNRNLNGPFASGGCMR